MIEAVPMSKTTGPLLGRKAERYGIRSQRGLRATDGSHSRFGTDRVEHDEIRHGDAFGEIRIAAAIPTVMHTHDREAVPLGFFDCQSAAYEAVK